MSEVLYDDGSSGLLFKQEASK